MVISRFLSSARKHNFGRKAFLFLGSITAVSAFGVSTLQSEGQKRIEPANSYQKSVITKLVSTGELSTAKKPISKQVSKKIYKRSQIAAHNTLEKGIWVTYQNGVYDITDFINIHPGGEKLLLAAGRAIDPFWNVFTIHNTSDTRELLENYRIGDLLAAELDDPQGNQSTGLELLFDNEPERDSSLKMHSSRPCNAESAMESLNTFITPNEKFYVRNHLQVPKIDPKEFRLEIEGPGIEEGLTLSLEDLKTKFKPISVTATLQCAGNRRKEMHQVKPVKGLQWQGGAISNAVWTGVRLRDVLQASGYTIPDLSLQEPFPGDVEHVQFKGAEGYGASIPAEKVFDPRGDVILAYEMNGEPIPKDHGYPLRALVPGNVAARSVKWVNKIILDSEESSSHWQQHDYKGFNPSLELSNSDYSKSESIQELPVTSSFILNDDKKISVKEGFVTVNGYAVSG
jgi:sulfite oxidase